MSLTPNFRAKGNFFANIYSESKASEMNLKLINKHMDK
jgi:hypothetical protein